MVHEYTDADRRWHDALNDLAIGSDFHGIWKSLYEQGRMGKREHHIYGSYEGDKIVQKDSNPNDLTNVEWKLNLIIPHMDNLKRRFQEELIIDQYRFQVGIITEEELRSTEDWNKIGQREIDQIKRYNYMFRGWEDYSGGEFFIIFDILTNLYKKIREMLRDRYTFDREIERRIARMTR